MATKREGGPKTAGTKIEPAKGKLGVMVVGMGAVATTMIAGVEAVRRGLAKPIGSLTQMGTIRLGKRTDNNSPLIKDFVPLADLNDIVFTGWDIFEDNVYEAAAHAQVLKSETLKQLKPYLETIKPMPAVFNRYYVKRLHGTHVKKGKSKAGFGRAGEGGYSRLQEDRGPRGDDLVRVHGDISCSQRPCISRLRPSRRDWRRTTRALHPRRFMPTRR